MLMALYLECQTIQISAKTGKLPEAGGSLQINANVAAKPLDAKIKFSGIVGLSEPYDIQGETDIQVSSLKDKLKNTSVNIDGDSVALKGLSQATRKPCRLRPDD